MGSSSSREVSNVQDIITTTTMESITAVQTNCTGAANTSQEFTFNFDNSETIDKCIDNQAINPNIDCEWLKADTVEISDNVQDMSTYIDFSCEVDATTATNVAAEVQAELSAIASRESDAIADVCNGTVNALTGGKSSDKTYNENNFTSEVSNIINNEFVTNMVNRVKAKQSFLVEVEGAIDNFIFSGNYQKMVNEVVGELLGEYEGLTEAVSAVEASMAADAQNKTAGIFSTLSDMFSMFGDNAMYMFLCVAFCCCALVFISCVGAIVAVNYKDVAEKAVNKMPSK